MDMDIIDDDQNPKIEEGNAINGTATIDEQPSKLFKLNTDCFGQIFDWLSLRELLLIRRMCKVMKQIVDPHIKRKYRKLQRKHISDYVNMYIIPRDKRSTYLEWCKHLYIKHISWTQSDSEGIETVLNQIETLKLEVIHIDGDLYDIVLKYCLKLKHLNLTVYSAESRLIFGTESK